MSVIGVYITYKQLEREYRKESVMNKTRKVWGISLMVMSVCALSIMVPNIFGMHIPDILTRILGIVGLVCIPIVAFTTIKIIKK